MCICYHTQQEMSRKIVPHKSLISLRIQTFFLRLPTVNSENPSGMGLFHPFLRAIETLGNTPATCMTWAIIQLSSIWKQFGSFINPKSSKSLSDTLGCMKLNSLDTFHQILIMSYFTIRNRVCQISPPDKPLKLKTESKFFFCFFSG